jgi:hypothetical protein
LVRIPIERRGHRPRRLAGGYDINRIALEGIEKAASRGALDQMRWIDSRDACAQNLLEIGAKPVKKVAQ